MEKEEKKGNHVRQRKDYVKIQRKDGMRYLWRTERVYGAGVEWVKNCLQRIPAEKCERIEQMTELRNQHFVISDEMSNLGKDYRLMKTF